MSHKGQQHTAHCFVSLINVSSLNALACKIEVCSSAVAVNTVAGKVEAHQGEKKSQKMTRKPSLKLNTKSEDEV